MAFAENLKQIRKEKGISQEELAEQLEVSRQAVSKWEQGAGYPEVEKLIALSHIFNVSLDSLLSEEAVKSSSNVDVTNSVVKTGKIRISSFDGKSIVNCNKVLSSQMFKARANEPKYALFGVDGYSLWGETSTVLGWYADEEMLKKEIRQIMEAINHGEEAYELKYAVPVKKHWWRIKIED